MTLQAYASDTMQTVGRGAPNAFSPASDGESYAVATGGGALSIVTTSGLKRGQITNDTLLNLITLGSLQFMDVDQYVTVSASSLLVGIGLISRYQNNNNYYRCDWNGSNLELVARVNGVTTTLASVAIGNFTPTVSTFYTIHFRTQGFGATGSNPNNLMANIYPALTTEPSGWQVVASDPNLFIQGSYGYYYKATTTGQSGTFDSYTVTDCPPPAVTPAFNTVGNRPYGATNYVPNNNTPPLPSQTVIDLIGTCSLGTNSASSVGWGNGSWLRYQMRWKNVETYNGLYDWAIMDDAVQKANYWGFRLLWPVQAPPDWQKTRDALGSQCTLTAARNTGTAYTTLAVTALPDGAYLPHGSQLSVDWGTGNAETVFVYNVTGGIKGTYTSGTTSIGISTSSSTTQAAWTPAHNHAATTVIWEAQANPSPGPAGGPQWASATAYANFCTTIATRYNGLNGYGKLDMMQCENEDYDTSARIGPQGPYSTGSSSPTSWDMSSPWDNAGAVLAPVYNAVCTAVHAVAGMSGLVIFPCSVRKTPNTAEQHIKNWVSGFCQRVAAGGGTVMGLDYHYYRDGTVDWDGTLVLDPTISTHVSSGGAINAPAVQVELADLKAVALASGFTPKIMAGETGWPIYDDAGGPVTPLTAARNAGTAYTTLAVTTPWTVSANIPSGTRVTVDWDNVANSEIVYTFGTGVKDTSPIQITTDPTGATQTAWTPAHTHAIGAKVYGAIDYVTVTPAAQSTYLKSMFDAMHTGGGDYVFIYTMEPTASTVVTTKNPAWSGRPDSITQIIGGTYTYEPAYSMTATDSATYATWGTAAQPLTLYFTTSAATTLTTARKLLANATTGSPNTSSATKIGTSLGYGEIWSQGNAGAWPALGAVGAPSGHGWFLEAASLNLAGNSILAGNWTPTLRNSVSVGTATADFITNVYKYNAGTYTLIGTFTKTANALTTAPTNFTFTPAAAGLTAFVSGDILYVDEWWNITANGTGSTAATANAAQANTGTTGSTSDQIVAPNYQLSAPVLATAPATLSFSGTVGGASPAPQNDTLSETAGVATAWTGAITYGSGAGWLAISPTSGTLAASGNQVVAVTCTTGALTAGTYTATITYTATTGGATATVAVTFVVTAAGTPVLARSAATLSFTAPVGGANPASQNDTLSETAGVGTAWTSSIAYGSGSGWLARSPTSGTLSANGSQVIALTCTTGTLAAGTYTATVTYTATTGGSTTTMAVTFIVTVPAVWTFDTANSRLVAAANQNALYLVTSVTAHNVQAQVVTNQVYVGGLVARYTSSSNYYLLTVSDDGGQFPQTMRLSKVVAGVTTLLASGAIGFVRGSYHMVQLTVTGSTLTGVFDGATIVTATDSDLTAPGLAGLFSGGSASNTANWYSLSVQQLGDDLTGINAAYKLTLTSTDPTVGPIVQDAVLSVRGPQLMSGRVLPATQYQYNQVSANTDDAAKQSNYWWAIQQAALVFQSRAARAAPWPLWSGQHIDVGYGTCDIQYAPEPTVIFQNTAYRNKQYITGGYDTQIFIDIKQGDGQATSWALSAKVDSVTSILVNGVSHSFGLLGVDAGMDYYYTPGDVNISQAQGAVPLAKTDAATITYVGRIDYVGIAENTAQQAILAARDGSTGIVENREDGGNQPRAAIDALAQARITQYAILDVRTWGFDTLRPGLFPGQLQEVFAPEFNINDGSFLITALHTVIRQRADLTTLVTYTVTCTEGPVLGTWARIFTLP